MTENPIERNICNFGSSTSNTGDYIFKEGDTENALYIVLTGRCRALAKTDKGLKALGDISAGEPVGEFALFT
ncbi:MAG: cyclic nucleotide-binding domain-containing protein [Saprospiraceae bacterium]|nr:cyclic nucleotide-binding domain-containing protein [Saprospiraceae bacterium]